MLSVDQLKQEVERLGFFEFIRFSDWVNQYKKLRVVTCDAQIDKAKLDLLQNNQSIDDEIKSDDFSIDYSKLNTKKTALGHYKLHYKGTNGEVSCREINLRNVFRKNETIYFSAYCHLRKQVKTFRADRVVLLEDLDNDMIFDKDLDVFFAAKLLDA